MAMSFVGKGALACLAVRKRRDLCSCGVFHKGQCQTTPGPSIRRQMVDKESPFEFATSGLWILFSRLSQVIPVLPARHPHVSLSKSA